MRWITCTTSACPRMRRLRPWRASGVRSRGPGALMRSAARSQLHRYPSSSTPHPMRVAHSSKCTFPRKVHLPLHRYVVLWSQNTNSKHHCEVCWLGVQAEMRQGLSYFHSTIFPSLPVFYRRIDTALKQVSRADSPPYTSPCFEMSMLPRYNLRECSGADAACQAAAVLPMDCVHLSADWAAHAAADAQPVQLWVMDGRRPRRQPLRDGRDHA